jgi:hypothetical protein
MSDDISDLRERIDTIDDSLIDLLNQRAEIARQVGEAKKRGDCISPLREKPKFIVACMEEIMGLCQIRQCLLYLRKLFPRVVRRRSF